MEDKGFYILIVTIFLLIGSIIIGHYLIYNPTYIIEQTYEVEEIGNYTFTTSVVTYYYFEDNTFYQQIHIPCKEKLTNYSLEILDVSFVEKYCTNKTLGVQYNNYANVNISSCDNLNYTKGELKVIYRMDLEQDDYNYGMYYLTPYLNIVSENVVSMYFITNNTFTFENLTESELHDLLIREVSIYSYLETDKEQLSIAKAILEAE